MAPFGTRQLKVLMVCALMVLSFYSAGEAARQIPDATSSKALELDGAIIGALKDVEGGYAEAEVVEESVGADASVRKNKRIGNPTYAEITLTAASGMLIGDSGPPTALFSWVKEFFNSSFTSKNGAIITVSGKQETGRLSFFNAVITEVTMPALDASSREEAVMIIKIAPEYTQQSLKSAGMVKIPTGAQKAWLASNFRLNIDGLDAATAKTVKIDSFTVRALYDENTTIGGARDTAQQTAYLEVPNLAVTVTNSNTSDTLSLYEWHNNFVIKGYNGENDEKGGSIEYLSTKRSTLFKVKLENIGIFKLADEKIDALSGTTPRIKAEIYCEGMLLE